MHQKLVLSRRYNNVPSSSPSSAGKPSPSQSPYPPLPPKQSPKPPLPNDPPKDTKDSKDLAPMGYGQMSQADMLKIYEAQVMKDNSSSSDLISKIK